MVKTNNSAEKAAPQENEKTAEQHLQEGVASGMQKGIEASMTLEYLSKMAAEMLVAICGGSVRLAYAVVNEVSLVLRVQIERGIVFEPTGSNGQPEKQKPADQ